MFFYVTKFWKKSLAYLPAPVASVLIYALRIALLSSGVTAESIDLGYSISLLLVMAWALSRHYFSQLLEGDSLAMLAVGLPMVFFAFRHESVSTLVEESLILIVGATVLHIASRATSAQ